MKAVPELPEVETVVRTLRPRMEGRRVVGLRLNTRKPWASQLGRVKGQTVRRLRRYGKYILADLDNGLLAIHLGMTGRLLAGAAPGPYTRAVLLLEGETVVFDDVRQFGSMRWLPEEPAGLGPDALSVPAAAFLERLEGRRTRLKALLLDQAFLRGLGNIYADESLFRAGVHPLAASGRLNKQRALRLHAAIQEVLGEAVEAGGSSVSDYVDADGRSGWFQFRHRVYQKTGEPCMVCGTPIRRILVAQRGTHFCPRCQRR